MEEAIAQRTIKHWFSFIYTIKDRKALAYIAISLCLLPFVLCRTSYSFASPIDSQDTYQSIRTEQLYGTHAQKIALGYGRASSASIETVETNNAGDATFADDVEKKAFNKNNTERPYRVVQSTANTSIVALSVTNSSVAEPISSYQNTNSARHSSDDQKGVTPSNSTGGMNLVPHSERGGSSPSLLDALDEKGESLKEVSASVAKKLETSESTLANKKASAVRLFRTVDFFRKPIKGNAPKWERVVNLEKKKKEFLAQVLKKECLLTYTNAG